MKKNISRKLSKATILLVAFVALTMVFTIYQTSINTAVVDFANELNIDEDLILGYLPLTANAASINSFTSLQMVDGYSMSNTWGSVVEKSETYTFTASLSNDAYKRAAYSAGAITFQSYFTITKSGNHSSRWYVEASGGASTASTTGSYISSGTSTSASVNLPGGTTTFTGYLNLRTQGKAFTQQTARAENCGITLIKGDTTAPTISGSTWQTSNTITITDSSAGINTITVQYSEITNGSTYTTNSALGWSASGTASTSRVTSKTITFDTYGKYKITVTDNVGNSNSKEIWYYSPSIKLNADPSDHGLVSLDDTLTEKGSSVSLENTSKKGDDSYYTYAAANEYYYFTGFTNPSVLTSGTLTYHGDYGVYVWKQQHTIQTPPKQNLFTHTANFSPIYNALEYLGADGNYKSFNASTSSWAFDYNGKARAPLKTKSGYYATFAYTGTTLAGTTYSSSTAPTYAGSYTVTVTMRMGSTSGNPTGKATYSFTINPINIVAKPGIADKIYDRTTLAIQSNNTGTTANATLWTYSIYDSTLSKTAETNDGTLTLTTIANIEFHFAKSSVGSTTIDIHQKNADGTTTKLTITNVNPFNSDILDFYFTGSATNNPVATITSTNNDLVKSYIVRTTTSGISKTIYPAPLTVKLGNYVNYNTTALPSTIYVGGKAFTDHSYIGKIYDGTFTSTLVDGDGITTTLFKQHNIKVYTEEEI